MESCIPSAADLQAAGIAIVDATTQTLLIGIVVGLVVAPQAYTVARYFWRAAVRRARSIRVTKKETDQ